MKNRKDKPRFAPMVARQRGDASHPAKKACLLSRPAASLAVSS
jgi:hypothetical protein